MNNDPCRYCQFNGTQGCPLTNCGAFPHCPQALKINWKDSLMECGNHIACASKMVADIKKQPMVLACNKI